MTDEQDYSERVCSDCEGLITHVADELAGGVWILELMCVLCGSALSLGGLLSGEAEALLEGVEVA